jgi:putative membrane protein
MRVLRLVTWLLWGLLFLVLLVFAFKNKAPVQLSLPLGGVLDFPLVGLLFAFFVVGTVLGVMASLVVVFQQKRQIVALRRELDARAPLAPEPALPPDVAG